MERFSNLTAHTDANPVLDSSRGSEGADTVESPDLETYRPTAEMEESMAAFASHNYEPFDESMALFEIPTIANHQSVIQANASEERKVIASQPVRVVDFLNTDLPFHNESWRWINEPLQSTVDRQRVRVLVTTWNMHGRPPPEKFSDVLPPQVEHHLVAIGSQECMRSIGKSMVNQTMKVWENQAAQALGSKYIMIRSHTLGPTHLMVFAHNSVTSLVSNIDSDDTATGVGNMLRNKGGAAISFSLAQKVFLFVCAHLPAGYKAVKKRTQAWNRIEKGLNIPRKFPRAEYASDRAEFTFFFGDLNYRINGDRDTVEFLSKQGALRIMLPNDQLTREQQAGKLPPGYSEGPITFPPTYRYDPGTNQFDSSRKRRIPAY